MPFPKSTDVPPAFIVQTKLPEAFNFVIKISSTPALVKLVPPNVLVLLKLPVT